MTWTGAKTETVAAAARRAIAIKKSFAKNSKGHLPAALYCEGNKRTLELVPGLWHRHLQLRDSAGLEPASYPSRGNLMTSITGYRLLCNIERSAHTIFEPLGGLFRHPEIKLKQEPTMLPLFA
jgi:hypothetical protein